MEGSYQLKEFTTSIEAEVHRLKGQVDLFFDKEFRIYREIGLKNGQKIIECGCGPGYLLTRILEQLPECRATGLEIDPYLVEILKAQSSKEGKQLFDVMTASITATGLPDNTFDLVIARLVIEHLPHPEQALKELNRILKPGGKLIIVSNDFSLHVITYPHIPELDLLYQAYCASQFAKGGNPRIGRQLPYLLHNTNFIRTNLEVVCAHSTINSEKAFFKAEDVHISAQLVKDGFLERNVLDTIARKWYDMLKTEGHALYRQLFIAHGEKSTAPLPVDTALVSPGKGTEPGNPLQQITGAPAAEKEMRIKEYLVLAIAEILEHDPAQIRDDMRFNTLGIDSISAVEFTNILLTDFGFEVSVSDLLENLTIKTLTGKIFLSLEKQGWHGCRITDLHQDKDKEWEEGEL